MSLAPVARAPLSIAVAEGLRAAILDGTFGADEELPTESDLATTFGVGRSTVREALRIVQAQGLVSGADTVSTARPRVTHDRTAGTAAIALGTALQVGAIPLSDLVSLRVLLEAESLRHVDRVPDAVRDLLDAMATAADAGDIEAFHLLDVEFHVGLAHASGNRAFGFVVGVLRESIASFLRRALAALDDPRPTLRRLHDEHAAIVGAIDSGDHDSAAALVVDHIHGFYATDPA